MAENEGFAFLELQHGDGWLEYNRVQNRDGSCLQKVCFGENLKEVLVVTADKDRNLTGVKRFKNGDPSKNQDGEEVMDFAKDLEEMKQNGITAGAAQLVELKKQYPDLPLQDKITP